LWNLLCAFATLCLLFGLFLPLRRKLQDKSQKFDFNRPLAQFYSNITTPNNPVADFKPDFEKRLYDYHQDKKNDSTSVK